MEYKGIRVLILEGYARQSLPFMRSFKKHGCVVSVLCNSKYDVAYWSRFPDEKILGICDPEKYDESEKYICNLIKSNKYDIVVPLVDFSAEILSKHKDELSSYARIAVNNYHVLGIAQDKLSVMKICAQNNLSCPNTLFNLSTIEEVLNANLMYPIVLKPRRGVGAQGFHLFQDQDQLVNFAASHRDLSQFVIQEYIPQSNMNLSCGLFIDIDGKVKSAYVYASKRWYPIKGGTGTLNELVERQDIVDICSRLAAIIGLHGIVGFDLIHDHRDSTAKIIEINPRVLACSKIGFLGGLDQVQELLEYEYGQQITPYETHGYGIKVRMSQIDALWFLKSPDRFRAKPSWFSHQNTKDQTFSFDDPLPWFAFLLRGLKRYRKEEEKRK